MLPTSERVVSFVIAFEFLFTVPPIVEGEVTQFSRNATGWRSSEPRYVGHTFDQSWPSQGSSFTGCNIDGQADPTTPRVLNLVGGQVTVTSKDAANQNICPIHDGTSAESTSDGILTQGGSFIFEFAPPVSAFYANYGSLAVGATCTMNLYAQDVLIDSITSAPSLDNGLASGHGFTSSVFIDRIRITCTEAGPVLIGAFRGTLGSVDDLGRVCVTAYDSDCSGPGFTPIDFACVFEGNEITMGLPGVGGRPDEFIAVPRGRSVYAVLVSGYAQNSGLNLLHYFNFANYILKQNGYVHYAWWNNLFAPYMYRPLHDAQSNPGDLVQDVGGFVPVPDPNGFFDDKARPVEDTQFQSDARKFLAAIKDADPDALLVVVGHSMGGGAVARLGSNSTTPIDILAPIDPVGNRSLPVGRVGQNDYNWTRWRATKNEFLGFKDQDCERFLGLCVLPLDCFPIGDWHNAPPVLGGWTPTALLCGPYVHNPSTRQFPNVRNLYHKWQTEASFPFDYDTNRYFNFTPPPGGTSIQQAVTTCAFGNDPIDPSINCGPLDGHGEIVGFRHVPPDAYALGATAWSSNANTRRTYLQQWETQGDNWAHRPENPNLCLVSNGLISLLQGIVAEQDASLVTEFERSTEQWKNAVPGRWETYSFDQYWPSPGSGYTGCTISGVADPTAPRTIQLAGGQITVSAMNSSGTLVCPLHDGTSAERTSDLVIQDGGKAIIEFSPGIGAFYANFGSLEVGDTVRMDLFASDQLIDFVISPPSPASSNGVQAIGNGFVSPTLIDRIEFTSTENGAVLIGGFRGVLSNADSLGRICVPAYSTNCTTLTELDFGCVFGTGPIQNQTQPNALFYYTIGAAIAAGRDGDVIECQPGVYREAVNFSGKAVTLRGGGNSTIDMTGLVGSNGSGVTCASGESSDTVLDGFTVTGGVGTLFTSERRGGGMYVDDSSPTVVNCKFIGNEATRGGGVFVRDGAPNFVNCMFAENDASWGAAIHNTGGTPTLINCLLSNNHATSGGGGVLIDGGTLSIFNNTLVQNSVVDGYGGGVLVMNESTMNAVNSIFWNNTSVSNMVAAKQILAEPDALVFVNFSDVQDDDPGAGTVPFGGTSNGNIDLAPRFADVGANDFRLNQTSPCIDAGDDVSVPPDFADLDGDSNVDEITSLDLARNARLFDADVGSFTQVDMGAYEFVACRGNFDNNEAIDFVDHAALIVCLESPQSTPPECIAAFDFNSDLNVSLADFRVFQLNFGCGSR